MRRPGQGAPRTHVGARSPPPRRRHRAAQPCVAIARLRLLVDSTVVAADYARVQVLVASQVLVAFAHARCVPRQSGQQLRMRSRRRCRHAVSPKQLSQGALSVARSIRVASRQQCLLCHPATLEQCAPPCPCSSCNAGIRFETAIFNKKVFRRMAEVVVMEASSSSRLRIAALGLGTCTNDALIDTHASGRTRKACCVLDLGRIRGSDLFAAKHGEYR